MLELKVFQAESAELIADRYSFFSNHPDRPRKGNKPRAFFQALSALTGAGKTPILAQAVSLIRAHLPAEPIVFWMSKAKPVVAQTYLNFSAGGKYSDILDGFRVINVGDLNPQLIKDSATPLLVMATTGLFNNKDQADGALNIYKKDNDVFGDQSPWDRLIERSDGSARRPLLIVYDEGHNLSEQQSELLAELEPDAYLLASATLRLPSNFQKSVVQPIRLWVEEIEDVASLEPLRALGAGAKPEAERFVTTAVDSAKVVEAELVKRAIQFDGTTAPMERCLDELHARMALLDQEIALRSLNFRPKAIYVCKTNINDDGEKDDPGLPFAQRNAPPIRIWRYLVEEKGIAPADIAIYANLAFADGSKPNEVRLFSKGETDFEDFKTGNFRHIVFNLSLQEGWDDPECYLAYVDKSMGSSIQVEQIIGRVLRQFGAKHYDTALLNSAHFFLRVDSQRVFSEAIQKVKTKLLSEGAPIEIIDSFGALSAGAEDIMPKEGAGPSLHHIFVDSEAARQETGTIIGDFPVFEEGHINTLGEAHVGSQLVNLDELDAAGAVSWKVEGHTNPVRLRWLISTAIKARSPRALAIVDLKDQKFDVRVQIASKANKLADKLAQEVVGAFYSLSDLAYESVKPFTFGAMRVPKNAPAFSNGVYERYSGMNKFELDFAHALDSSGELWHRNPSAGGFYIPLLSEGDTSSFYPDFLVWKKGLVYCLDTKGSHLLSDAVARKLFDIKEDNQTKALVRFITEGRQTALLQKPSKGGYTVWKMKAGSPTAVHVADLAKAVAESLK
jgi:type III restriction enzyme